jgi:hypothetical protein
VLFAHARDRIQEILKIDMESVRDHARGLLEAEASVVVSAAEFLQNQFFAFGHIDIPIKV